MVTCRPAMGMTDAVALPMVPYCTNQDRGIGLSIYHGSVSNYIISLEFRSTQSRTPRNDTNELPVQFTLLSPVCLSQTIIHNYHWYLPR